MQPAGVDCSERTAKAGEGKGELVGGVGSGVGMGAAGLVAAAVSMFTRTWGYNSSKSIYSQYASGDGEWIY